MPGPCPLNSPPHCSYHSYKHEEMARHACYFIRFDPLATGLLLHTTLSPDTILDILPLVEDPVDASSKIRVIPIRSCNQNLIWSQLQDLKLCDVLIFKVFMLQLIPSSLPKNLGKEEHVKQEMSGPVIRYQFITSICSTLCKRSHIVACVKHKPDEKSCEFFIFQARNFMLLIKRSSAELIFVICP